MEAGVRGRRRAPPDLIDRFWALPESALLAALTATERGLSSAEATARLARYGPNRTADDQRLPAFRLLARQLANPLVVILLFGAAVSLVLREWIDAAIITAIVVGSAIVSFFQEYRASTAIAALRRQLSLKSAVYRDGELISVPAATLVPGDIVDLAAGAMIPADGRILRSQDFLVTEASLTGESMPVDKMPGMLRPDVPLADRTNSVFMGSSVRSGTARVLIVRTGRDTTFGAIAGKLRRAAPPTEFAHGIAQFGALLLRIMLLIVIAVFAINQSIGRPLDQSLLFAVALAVGLSPELLPAIISATLSAGARQLARGGVIVRRLEAIENLGSIDTLCTDKTGTLTRGTVSLEAAVDPEGKPSSTVRQAGYLNAWFESGIANPLDTALIDAATAERWQPTATKRAEMPYDFARRRLSVVVGEGDACRLITKGAFADMLAVCTMLRSAAGDMPIDGERRAALEDLFRAQGEGGLRVLAVAERPLVHPGPWTRDDEAEMTLIGFLLFADPPKADVAHTLRDLARLGVVTKVITGDNRYVAAHVGAAVGLDTGHMLTGAAVAAMSDAALTYHAKTTTLFVEIDPQQKERIVRALRRGGHVTGFLGDGINDAPALHAADVGISVDQAVDVARESADIVLLHQDLAILCQGVIDGRRTFANTLKYIMIATSSTFGNMVSMAIATPLLPFLPLLPKQILLNNFMSDLPALALSTDAVDPEALSLPRRWQIGEVRRFMVMFGLLSSCFDLMTFAVLLSIFHVGEAVFQTVWFVISLLTEILVVLVLRTTRSAWASRPSRSLIWSTLVMAVAAIMLPLVPPIAAIFGFARVSLALMGTGVAIVIACLAAVEALKRWQRYLHPR